MTTTTESPAGLIEELFCKGHPLDAVVAVGQNVGWTRDDVLAVLRDRQWDLDGSGRLPRSKRVTVPQGLRAARPPASPTSPPPVRRTRLPEEPLPRAVVDAPSIDEWPGPVDVVCAEPPAPAAAPARASRPSAAALSAIADWAADDTAAAPPPRPPATEEPQQPGAEAERPAPQRAVIPPPDTDAAVARFLAERTLPAPDEQFLTSPDLRAAYEAWRGPAAAPAVTTRQFGTALTARYRKKQSSVSIGGAKPMCYHGLTWKPTDLSPPALVEPASFLDVAILEEARASVALDGETQVIGGAYTAASPRPVPEAVVVLEPDTDAFDQHLAKARETLPEAISPTGAAPDLLAVGLEHPNRRIRLLASRVRRAVDELCDALSGSGDGRG